MIELQSLCKLPEISYCKQVIHRIEHRDPFVKYHKILLLKAAQMQKHPPSPPTSMVK